MDRQVNLKLIRRKKPGSVNLEVNPDIRGTSENSFPLDEGDVIEDILPEKCCHCGKALDTDHNPSGGKYFRYQMTDVPRLLLT
jgi:hypothetical protein